MTARIVVPSLYVLAQSAVAVSHTGNTSETTLATVTVPAGAMGANGSIRITTIWANNNTANNKTARVRWNGVAGTAMLSANNTTSVQRVDQRIVANRNATNSQFLMTQTNNGGWGTGASAHGTAAIDTTAAVGIVISGQLADGADSITLDYYLVEIMYRA